MQFVIAEKISSSPASREERSIFISSFKRFISAIENPDFSAIDNIVRAESNGYGTSDTSDSILPFMCLNSSSVTTKPPPIE